MGEFLSLQTANGDVISAYVATPKGNVVGGVVICQEIFGVNRHIQKVANRYALEGFHAVAPALFDRVKKGVELSYDQQGVSDGVELMKKSSLDLALVDVDAAANYARMAGRVGIVGYCWGGTVAWAAACRLQSISAAVAYYGGGIDQIASERQSCPVLGHFGSLDKSIPMDVVEQIKAKNPATAIHIYEADHGFNCDERASFNERAAAIAHSRSIEFLKENLSMK